MMHRRWALLPALAVAAVLAAGASAAPPETMKLDAPVKDFALTNLWTNKPVKLSEMKGKPVVGVFISQNCDVTWRYEKRIGKLMQTYMPKGVKFLAVRSSATDTAEGIKKYAEAKSFTMPLLYDEKNAVADYFKAQVTPTFFVVDGQGTLRYWGSADDNPEEAEVKKTYVKDALDAVLAGKQVIVKETRPFG